MTVPQTHNSQHENENTRNPTVNVDALTEPATAADPDMRGHTRGSMSDRTPPRRSFSPDDRKLWSDRSACFWPCSLWSRPTWRRTTRRSLTVFLSGLSGRRRWPMPPVPNSPERRQALTRSTLTGP
jgi:hypothetical protein